jgi:hypothetical protein
MFSKKNEAQPGEKKEDDYQYVSIETVQSLVFLVYIAYKKGVSFAKDVIFVKDFYTTIMVLILFTLLDLRGSSHRHFPQLCCF